MSDAQLEAVLAGSKGFALALFVPLTEQVGIRPRVATDATQALALVEAQQGLVVVEVEGEGTVRSIQELLAARKDFTVVAAVPDAQVGTQDALRALGVELARWDGSAASVMGAVSRRLGAGPAALAAPAPGAPSAPPSTQRAAPPPPVKVPAPANQAAPAPPAPAAPAPPTAFFADLEPAIDDLDVVSVDDLSLEPGTAAVAAPFPPAAAAAAPAPAALAATATGGHAWPAGGLSSADADVMLVRGIGGDFSAVPRLRVATEGVVGTLSGLEVAVMMGDKVKVSPEPIRRAAIMRLRVAHALAERPPPGSEVDQGALSAMLGEIDGLLSEVSALAQGAPPEILPPLEAVRNALVKEAIDFSEAAQQIAPAGVPAPAVGQAPSKRLPGTRVLTVNAEAEPAQRRSRALYVGLGLALVVAGGFHGWRWYDQQRARVAPPVVTGAPASAMGGATANGSKFITSKDGRAFTEAEIETFRQREELQGRRVQVVSANTLISLPASAPILPINPALVPVPAPSPASPQRPQGAVP